MNIVNPLLVASIRMFNTSFRYIYSLLNTPVMLSLFFLIKMGSVASDQLDQTKYICLTMIVKNESKIIERCLNSVKNIVDCISICDTGSTDNTVAIIEEFMEKNNIPGKVHRDEWKNFGFNRTLSATRALETLKELGFPLSNTYLLLLDADMILKLDDFSPKNLKHDSYLVLQKSSHYSYYNTRFIKASLPWKCIGPTHEYWTCTDFNPVSLQLSGLYIDDVNDGGCKADKFERDVKLLTQGLQEEPDNTRYMFYLAQSHKNLENYEEAIDWFKKQLERNGWKEEQWFAMLMIGDCYEALNNWDLALHWYLKAFEYNPVRAEPLQNIAAHYRTNGEHHLAYMFANHGKKIPRPSDQLLFIADSVYDYKFDEELSISAYYTPFKEEGFISINRLVLKKNLPIDVHEQAYRNILFYLTNLKGARFIPIKPEVPPLRQGLNEYYHPLNPSIQKTPDGYKMICRTVNYSQKGGSNFKSRDPEDDTIRTRNFFIFLDRNFNIVSQYEILNNKLPVAQLASRVQGEEDCRLVEVNGKDFFICTINNTVKGRVTQNLCELENIRDGSETINVEKFIPLRKSQTNSCEKNWLPFTSEGKLYTVYGYDPFIVDEIDVGSGDCKVAFSYEPQHDLSKFRGSAAPIKWDDGYLMLVHEVVQDDERYYMHRFLYLDKDFKIEKMSKPFTFLHKGVEYCCGMTLDHSGKTCILPIGFEDKKAFLCLMDVNNIRAILEPLP